MFSYQGELWTSLQSIYVRKKVRPIRQDTAVSPTSGSGLTDNLSNKSLNAQYGLLVRRLDFGLLVANQT